MNRRPVIICLCGSTRFKQEFIAANFRETMAGKIVLSVGLYSHADAEVYTPTEAEKQALDELHLRKIDLATEVLVLNQIVRQCPACRTVWRHDQIRVEKCSCGAEIAGVPPAPYIGQSTAREIAYAISRGKPIRYLVEPEGQTP